MTYHLSLRLVTLVLGGLGLLGGLIAAYRPAEVRRVLLGLPRNFRAGVAVMIVAIIWTGLLIHHVDLTEMAEYRTWLIVFFTVLGIMTVLYLPDFLFPRALGIVLLLATEVLLSATFPVLHPARHIVTVIGYLWAIAGMFFVTVPYVFRDMVGFFHSSEAATRRTGLLKAAFGVCLIALGATCF